MTKQIKVLVVGESSYLSTGFAVLSREILSRLHADGRFDITELGCFGTNPDPRTASVPWRFLSNMPRSGDTREEAEYRSYPTNAFGEWRFEDALLAVRPHWVADLRDFWCLEYQGRSPFRRFFRWAVMPAVDSLPVDEQFVAGVSGADAVLGYSRWGLDGLLKQAPRLKAAGVASPGVDHAVFRVRPGGECRAALGIPGDALVVGFVARNQTRKLFPDLINAFARLRGMAPDPLRGRLRLYLHTAFPDVGWNLPRLIRDAGVSRWVLFTYLCRACGRAFASSYRDGRAFCPCGSDQAWPANSDVGVSREQLATIYSSLDAYVGYATAAGFEMPVAEAAACGVKPFVLDHAAMADFVDTLRAEPVRVARMFCDGPTHSWRALPDDEDCARKLLRWLSLPEPARRAEGARVATACGATYTYEAAAKVWADAIVGLPPADPWDSPPRAHSPARPPDGLDSFEFVSVGLQVTAGRPDLVGSFTHLRLARDLERGLRPPHTGPVNVNDASAQGETLTFSPYSYEDCLNDLLNLHRSTAHWDAIRSVAHDRLSGRGVPS